MNEDYVSLEAAKLLKEKGFEEYCGAFYCLGDDKLVIRDAVRNDNRYIISAPTLYMAQKWLREKKDIHITIDTNAGGYFYDLFDTLGTSLWETEIGPNGGGCWDTYESALDAGILKTLKMI